MSKLPIITLYHDIAMNFNVINFSSGGQCDLFVILEFNCDIWLIFCLLLCQIQYSFLAISKLSIITLYHTDKNLNANFIKFSSGGQLVLLIILFILVVLCMS